MKPTSHVTSLLSYQTDMLGAVDGGAPFTVVVHARRVGVTYALALAAFRYAQNRGGKVWYRTSDEGGAFEFAETCQAWAADHDITSQIEVKRQDRWRSFVLKLPSGGQITAMPAANPWSPRGQVGLTIFDPAAYLDGLAALVREALIATRHGGQLVVASARDPRRRTPFDAIEDEVLSGVRPGHLISVTLADALQAGLYGAIASHAVRMGKPLLLSQEEWEAEIRRIYGEDASAELDCIPAERS